MSLSRISPASSEMDKIHWHYHLQIWHTCRNSAFMKVSILHLRRWVFCIHERWVFCIWEGGYMYSAIEKVGILHLWRWVFCIYEGGYSASQKVHSLLHLANCTAVHKSGSPWNFGTWYLRNRSSYILQILHRCPFPEYLQQVLRWIKSIDIITFKFGILVEILHSWRWVFCIWEGGYSAFMKGGYSAFEKVGICILQLRRWVFCIYEGGYSASMKVGILHLRKWVFSTWKGGYIICSMFL